MWTINATLMPIIFILLAPVTSSSFNIVIARTLPILIALESFGTARVTIARLTTIGGETILIRLAFVTLGASHSGFTEALTRVRVTRCVVASDWIAVTTFTTVTGGNIPVTILAFVTIASDDVGFTVAIAGELVTDVDPVVSLFGAAWIAGTLLTLAVWGGEWIAEVTWKREINFILFLKNSTTLSVPKSHVSHSSSKTTSGAKINKIANIFLRHSTILPQHYF